MRILIARHPLMAYFTLTFALSWGGLLLAAGGPSGIPVAPEEVETLLPLFVACVLVGPSVSGILLTVLIDGSTGLENLRSRLLRWRVGVRWYAMALLLAPLTMVGLYVALSPFSARFVPAFVATEDRSTVLVAGFLTALGAGFFEELGWTGFAVPRHRLRNGVLGTGLVVGLAWAVWHLLPALWMSGAVSGRFALTSYLLDPFLFLIAFRVLMVWVYEHTGSLLLAMIMHASLTFAARVVTPQGMSGVPLMIFDLTWALTICAITALIVVANRGRAHRDGFRLG